MHPNPIIKGILKHKQFNYGWIILFMTALGLFFSGPGQTYFASAFIDSYIADFGFSRATVSSLYSIATLISGLLLFLVGRAADQFGQKKIVLIAAVVLSLTCLLNSFISNLPILFIGFFLGRIAGQGSMTLLPTTLLPHWFVKKRAFAFSLMSLGTVTGSTLIPPLNTWLISLWGWPLVWRFWAGLLFFLFIPLTAVFLYNKPEALGRLPDNTVALPEAYPVHADIEILSQSWTLKEAMATRSFWGILFSIILMPMITTGIVFHFVSILGTKGISAVSASFILSLLAIVSFPVTLVSGVILDRIQKLHYVIAVICGLQFIGLVILWLSDSIYATIAFIVLQGTAMGIQSVCDGIIWPHYFGIEHLGSIRGVIMTATVIGSALGPIPFGLVFDWSGSYDLAFLIMMCFPGICFFASLASPKPNQT